MTTLLAASAQAMRLFAKNYAERHPEDDSEATPVNTKKKRLEVRVDTKNKLEYLVCVDQEELSLSGRLLSAIFGSGKASVKKIMEFCKTHPEVIADPEVTAIFYRMIDSYAQAHGLPKTDRSLLRYFEQIRKIQNIRQRVGQGQLHEIVVKPIATFVEDFHEVEGLSAVMGATDKHKNTLAHDIIKKSKNDRLAADTLQAAFSSFLKAARTCKKEKEAKKIISSVLSAQNNQKKTALFLALEKDYVEAAQVCLTFLVMTLAPKARGFLTRAPEYNYHHGIKQMKLYEKALSLAQSMDLLYGQRGAFEKIEGLLEQDDDKKTLLHKVFEFGHLDLIQDVISVILELIKNIGEGDDLRVKEILREALLATDTDGRLVWHYAYRMYEKLGFASISPLLELAVQVFGQDYNSEIAARTQILDKNKKSALQLLAKTQYEQLEVIKQIETKSKEIFQKSS